MATKIYRTVNGDFPPMGRYVCVHYCGGNWSSKDPHKGQNWSVAARKPCQVFGNQKLPWRWETFGPGRFFPEDIDMWFYLPEVE